jgi:vacuolar-type H+-ATPase subunit E/Vma4
VSAEAIRTIVLADVESDAGTVDAAAEAEARAELERAQARARAVVERARREGAAAGDLEGARERAEARRRSQRLVLDARRAVYDDFRREAHEGALLLRASGGYGALLERLAEAARSQLGTDAELEVDPAGVGGVRARAGARAVDYTLPALVDRCIASLGSEVERLWS